MKNHKVNVDSNHTGAWEPRIIVGTSIGAVNGAAIAQGMPADQLVEVWKSLEEKDIQGLPAGDARHRALGCGRDLQRGDGRQASADRARGSHLAHPKGILAAAASAPTLGRRKVDRVLDQSARYRTSSQDSLTPALGWMKKSWQKAKSLCSLRPPKYGRVSEYCSAIAQ